jgi:hypothetical protein
VQAAQFPPQGSPEERRATAGRGHAQRPRVDAGGGMLG